MEAPKHKPQPENTPQPPAGDGERPFMTGQDILDSGIIGMWADRKDIDDSVEFAHQLREKNQRRRFSR